MQPPNGSANREAVQILLIEEIAEEARTIMSMLEDSKAVRFKVDWAGNLAEGLQKLDSGRIQLVLMDISSTGGVGLQSFIKAQGQAPRLPIIVLSNQKDETLAVQAMHEGAQDYIVKGEFDCQLLVRAIRYAIERKLSEAALLHAQQKYRSIFDHTVEGIFQTTPAGQYISANPALARIYGYESPEELYGHLRDISRQLYVEPGRRDQFIGLMEENAVVRDFESRIYRKDGKIIWISENVRTVRDDDGHVLYYEGTVEDITNRKKIEDDLRDSETLYHSLVENLPQNIFRKNLSEQFTFANQRFCETLGKPLGEIIGKTDFDFFPPELAAKYQKDDQIIMETGKLFETIEEHQPPHGEKIYVQVFKSPLYDAKGKIIGLQGIFWDITERKRAEERVRRATIELSRSREELREKNEQLEEDIRMARDIQQAILPQQYPVFPASSSSESSLLRFVHRYIPTGAVGGDFFNVLRLSDTQAGVFICDVMGHGVRSALVTAILRALVEELTRLATDPGQLLSQINRDLRSILRHSGMFTTAFYMVADLESGTVTYANAGHPKPAVLRRETGQAEFLANSRGKSEPALGLFDEFNYSVSACPLRPNDLFVLFTDGVYDVEHPGTQSSSDWLLEEFRQRRDLSAAQLFDQLLDRVHELSIDGQFADDVCLLGMEVSNEWKQSG